MYRAYNPKSLELLPTWTPAISYANYLRADGIHDEELLGFDRFVALESLGISKAPNVSADALALLGKGRELKELELGDLELDDGALARAFRAHPIRKLALRRLPNAAGEWVGALSELRELRCWEAKIAPGAWAKLAALEHLSLVGTRVDRATLAALAGLPRLHTLTIREGQIEPDALEVLGRSESLRHVSIGTRSLSETESRAVAESAHLESITVVLEEDESAASLAPLGAAHARVAVRLHPRACVTDAMLTGLVRALPQLTHLDLDQHSVTGRTSGLTVDGLASLGGLASLRWLSLRQVFVIPKIKPEDLSFLAGLEHLEELSLEGIGTKGRKQIEPLSKLPLRRLCLSHVGDRDLGALAALPLRALKLEHAKLTAKGFARLGTMSSLEDLSIRIEDKVVDSADLAPLRELPNLRRLWIDARGRGRLEVADLSFLAPSLREACIKSKSVVSDAWFVPLEDAAALEYLTLLVDSPKKVTKKGARLLAAAPALRTLDLRDDAVLAQKARDVVEEGGRMVIGSTQRSFDGSILTPFHPR